MNSTVCSNNNNENKQPTTKKYLIESATKWMVSKRLRMSVSARLDARVYVHLLRASRFFLIPCHLFGLWTLGVSQVRRYFGPLHFHFHLFWSFGNHESNNNSDGDGGSCNNSNSSACVHLLRCALQHLYYYFCRWQKFSATKWKNIE